MEILLLHEREIRELMGPTQALPVVRESFVELARGHAVLPGFINLDLLKTGAEVHVRRDHLEMMPFFSVKVASVSYGNPSLGLPLASGVFVLSDAAMDFP